MNVCIKFYCNPSYSDCCISLKTRNTNRQVELKQSLKLLKFILWGTRLSAPSSIAIHSTVVVTFHSKLEMWTCWWRLKGYQTSLKSLRLILWGARMSAPGSIVIHPIVVAAFHSKNHKYKPFFKQKQSLGSFWFILWGARMSASGSAVIHSIAAFRSKQ